MPGPRRRNRLPRQLLLAGRAPGAASRIVLALTLLGRMGLWRHRVCPSIGASLRRGLGILLAGAWLYARKPTRSASKLLQLAAVIAYVLSQTAHMVLTECVGNKARGLARICATTGLPWASPFCVPVTHGDLLAGTKFPTCPALAARPRATPTSTRCAPLPPPKTPKSMPRPPAPSSPYWALRLVRRTFQPPVSKWPRASRPPGRITGSLPKLFLAQPAASGVLFTHPERYLLNLAPGLCTYVVQGHPVEEIGCHPSGRIYRRQTPPNLAGWTWTQDEGLTELQASAFGLHPSPSRRRFHASIVRIQKSYGRAMDIEWSYADGKIYVLQARPVTREWHQEPWLLDNSNLAESYAGTVQPMTSSVAQRLYRHVYEDLLAASGVPRRKLAEHAAIFSQLVTAYHGADVLRHEPLVRHDGLSPRVRPQQGELGTHDLRPNPCPALFARVPPTLTLACAGATSRA